MSGTYEGRRHSGKGARTPTSVFVMFVVSEVSAGFWGVLHTVPAVRRMFLVTIDSIRWARDPRDEETMDITFPHSMNIEATLDQISKGLGMISIPAYPCTMVSRIIYMVFIIRLWLISKKLPKYSPRRRLRSVEKIIWLTSFLYGIGLEVCDILECS